MARKKQLYYNKTTQQGDNTCPACNGDAVELGDYEQGQADIDVRLCGLCEGTGVAVLNKDYKVNVEYTENGPIHEISLIKKEDRADA